MKISTGLGALVIGLALASTAAIAQEAPLSPGGISAAADAFGGPGPGYIGPRTQVVTPRAQHGPLYNFVPQAAPAAPSTNYNVGPTGAPLSPGGISTGGSSFGGPGYNPPAVGR